MKQTRFGFSTADRACGRLAASNQPGFAQFSGPEGMPKETPCLRMTANHVSLRSAAANLPCPTGSAAAQRRPQFLRSACPQWVPRLLLYRVNALRNTTSRLTGSLCCRFAFPPSGAIVGGRFPRCGMIVCSLRRPGAAPDEGCPNAVGSHRSRSPWSGSQRRRESACSLSPRQPACP